jgi:hypothetical protein
VARRRWQEGTVYLRENKRLPDSWWGRYVETVETEAGQLRVQRNVRASVMHGTLQSRSRKGHCGSTWTGPTTTSRLR